MKHNPKVISINGLQGLFLILFGAVCLCAGFIIFPGYLACIVWNYFAGFAALPLINLFQGVLLWSIVLIIGYIVINNQERQIIAVKTPQGLDEEELREIMKIIRSQHKIQPMLIETPRLKRYELKEITNFSDIFEKPEEPVSQDNKKDE